MSVILNTKKCDSINYPCTRPHPNNTFAADLVVCVPLSIPKQIHYICISKLPQDTTLRLTACFWNVGRFHCALSCRKGNTGPALKKEIKWQIGEGGGESPPVPDSCLDWQKRICQSGRVSVFSPGSTALTSPAARPEVCVGSTHIHSARNKNCGHQLPKIEQNCLTPGFFPLYSKKHPFIHASILPSIIFSTGEGVLMLNSRNRWQPYVML